VGEELWEVGKEVASTQAQCYDVVYARVAAERSWATEGELGGRTRCDREGLGERRARSRLAQGCDLYIGT
jgi:hypothetical protein